MKAIIIIIAAISIQLLSFKSNGQTFNLSDSTFKTGDILICREIVFDLAKSTLRQESFIYLDSIVDFLNRNDDLVIEVGNHTDSRGSDMYSTCLTCNRAKSVVAYLVSKGISMDRLRSTGYKDTKPIISDKEIAKLATVEDVENAHQTNRRTEFKIIGIKEASKTSVIDSTFNAQKKTSTINPDSANAIIKKIMSSIPSTFEIEKPITQSGAEYNGEWPNPSNNWFKYCTTQSMALNAGVYGVDIIYSSLYNKSQATLIYLSLVKKLTDMLVPADNDVIMDINYVEQYFNNKDSLLKFITDFYSKYDSLLCIKNRYEIATLIVIGGFVEGSYLACNAAKSVNNNPYIIQRIFEQGRSISDLIFLLESCKCDYLSLSMLNDRLKELNQIVYDANVDVQGTGPGKRFTKQSFDLYFNKISEIRKLILS